MLHIDMEKIFTSGFDNIADIVLQIIMAALYCFFFISAILIFMDKITNQQLIRWAMYIIGPSLAAATFVTFVWYVAIPLTIILEMFFYTFFFKLKKVIDEYAKKGITSVLKSKAKKQMEEYLLRTRCKESNCQNNDGEENKKQ